MTCREYALPRDEGKMYENDVFREERRGEERMKENERK